LVASDESGGRLVRLTQSRGRNNYPACSPDGRLVAFFSTRKSDEGPGLYIMRIDGRRPKRISTLVGDSLRWARLPVGARAAKAAAKPTSKLTVGKAGHPPMRLKVKPDAKSAPKPGAKSTPKPDAKP
jgi:hypothetical protein